jgi:hypothetical protein
VRLLLAVVVAVRLLVAMAAAGKVKNGMQFAFLIICFLLWGVLAAGLYHGRTFVRCVHTYMLFMYEGTCIS